MNLRYEPVTDSFADYAKVQHLFETAFPPEERPPFDMLLRFRHNELFAIYDGEVFVGLADVVERTDLVYLFFLAVEDDRRDQGYGSAILSGLKKRYDGKTIFLLAEEHDESSPTYEDRLRRFAFYERNGFLTKRERVLDYGVWYEILYTPNPVTASEFKETMRYMLGDEAYCRFYAKE